MGKFIRLAIDTKRCVGVEKCGQCILVCPVDIYSEKAGMPIVVEKEEDECLLCFQCSESCLTDAIDILKLYEPGS